MSLFGVDKIRDDRFGVRLGGHDGIQSLRERQMAGGYSECFLQGNAQKVIRKLLRD